jgi:hypothetical protein
MFSNNRGSIAIFAGLSLVMLLGFASFVVDLGYGLVAKNALQNAADATSLAAARELGRIYRALPGATQSSYQLTASDRIAIVSEATTAAQRNSAAGTWLDINDDDIVIGQWDSVNKTLIPNIDPPDAVMVMARRDGLANGPISTFFAGIIGRHTVAVTARATAALSGLGYVGPGKLEMPVGISELIFENGGGAFCGENIVFYPTNNSCSGWTTFHESSNASALDEILDGLLNGTYVAPEVLAGNTSLEFTGGNVASDLPDLKALYDDRKDENGAWETTVAVYAGNDCDNPSGAIEIVGFSKVVITTVLAPPAGQLIEATIICEQVEDGRGGGSNLGVIGSIPLLVQ